MVTEITEKKKQIPGAEDIPGWMRTAAKLVADGLDPIHDLAISISEKGATLVGRMVLGRTMRAMAEETKDPEYKVGLLTMAATVEKFPEPHPEGHPAICFVLFEWSTGTLLCRFFDKQATPEVVEFKPNAVGGQA
jgi:hypothetical protein